MVKTGQEIEEIINRYISRLADIDISVERVLLFGSYANGRAREDSDIDLIIISRDFTGMDIRERQEALGIAAARIMQPVQARGYTPEEIESEEKDPFLSEILSHSKLAA